MSMRDMAGWYLEAIDDLDIGQVNVVGFSLGGWLAAELATMSPELFRKLVLVAPAGVRPPVGQILDMFLITMPVFLETSVRDKDAVAEFSTLSPEEPTLDLMADWEDVREVACMLSWRPYMHNPTLPQLLHRLKRLPTLLVWGRDDEVIPLSAGQLYNESIPGLPPGRHRQLRPPPGDRAPSRIRRHRPRVPMSLSVKARVSHPQPFDTWHVTYSNTSLPETLWCLMLRGSFT